MCVYVSVLRYLYLYCFRSTDSNFSSSSRNRYSRTSSSFDTEDVSPSGVEVGPGDDESVLSPQSSITSATSASSGGSQRGGEKGGSSESKDSRCVSG